MKDIDLITMQVNLDAICVSLQMRLSTIEARKELNEKQKSVRDDLKALVQLAWESKATAHELEQEFKRLRSVAFQQEHELIELRQKNEELVRVNKNLMGGI